MRKRLSSYPVAIGLVLLCWGMAQGPGTLRGQTSSFGAIVGVVTDPSQAAVPDVSVTVTDIGKGITREVKTNQDGQYRVGSLLPAVYSVKATHAGFQLVEVARVEVPVTRTVTVNITMQIGAVSQKVEVTGVATQLDTSTATLGTVVNNTTVVTIPLNGRSYTDMIQLVPGTTPAWQGQPNAVRPGGTNYNVNGNHSDHNSFTLDGINANDVYAKQYGIQPSIDALQEFRVQTNITSADAGGESGAQVAVALKSGTNQLHGSAFEFLRNDHLDSVDWFTNMSSPAGQAVRPAYHQNQWGLVVGGPVLIPKVYNGRDKLFFLFNYEGFKTRKPSLTESVMATATELSGDLRDQPPVFDPWTTTQVGTDSSGNPIYHRDQISCKGVLNVICPDRLNPTTAAYTKYYSPMQTTTLAWFSNTTRIDQYQINARADYRISEKMNFFARYSHSNEALSNATGPPAASSGLAPLNLTPERFRNAVASWTYVPTPTTVLDIKLGFNRSNVYNTVTTLNPSPQEFLTKYPIQGVSPGTAAHPVSIGMGIAGSGVGSSGGGGSLQPVNDIEGILNLSKVWGSHTFKTGATWDNYRALIDSNPEVSAEFWYQPTQDLMNPGGGSGSAIASYLLGLPWRGFRQIGTQALNGRWSQYQFYVQDEYRVTRRLTLNYGLRYEYDQLPRDRDNHLAQFDMTTGLYVWASTNPVTGQGPSVRGTIRDPDYNNFSPRIGLAYLLNSKTTIRAGYGIFYATNYLQDMSLERGHWPYAASESLTGSNYIFPTQPIEKWFSPWTTPQPGTTWVGGLWGLARTDRTSYTQQWNLGVQHQLPRNMMLEVDYVATQGVKLPMQWPANTPPPGPGDVDPRRPYPQAGLVESETNRGISSYNALQVRFEKRLSQGLQFTASYAWSHYLDECGGGFTAQCQPSDPNNLRNEWASGAFDYRHIFTVGYVYEMPFGRGKHLLSHSSGAVNQILGGWQLSGITHYNSGGPVQIQLYQDPANNGLQGQHPDRVLGVPMTNHDAYPGCEECGWVNPAAFSNPAPYHFGTLGRFSGPRGPSFVNWDTGILKNFPLHGEKTVLQFRAEMFNTFNNVTMQVGLNGLGAGWWPSYYCVPLPSCNPNFGTAMATFSKPREIQFALKLLF